MRGAGRGIGAIIERLIETPWLAYAFLLALVACFLFFFLDHHKFKHPVPITLLISIIVVAMFRNAQGHGLEYALIWIFGCVGCFVYWLDRQIRSGMITRY